MINATTSKIIIGKIVSWDSKGRIQRGILLSSNEEQMDCSTYCRDCSSDCRNDCTDTCPNDCGHCPKDGSIWCDCKDCGKD